jgi:heterodisulfide reductase subunit B
MTTVEAISPEPLAQLVEREVGQNIFLCYQCVKCSSGCPLAEAMDILPHQAMRLVQLSGHDDTLATTVLQAKTIWLCASCQTCTTRCPQGLDVAGIMDALVIEARRRRLPVPIPEIDKFNTLFLRNIARWGRLYEVGLTAEMNLSTGQPLKDAALGWQMLKRNKLKLFPKKVRRSKKRVKPIAPAQGQVAYYPGCSLHASAVEYDQTVRATAEALGLALVEPPGWLCCGAGSTHRTDPTLATALPARTLALVEQMGLDTVTTPCSACFSRMKMAGLTLAANQAVAGAIEEQLGYAYRGTVRVQHWLDTLIEQAGLDNIAARVRRPLTGLKVACYYGCLMTRPPHLTAAEDYEYPLTMDQCIRALGAETVDWSYKTDCCGGPLSLSQTPLAGQMTRKILEDAYRCGADLIATACPLCHLNLEARQGQLQLDFQLPVLYLTQLMVLAFGLGDQQAALAKNIIDPRPVLRAYLA